MWNIDIRQFNFILSKIEEVKNINNLSNITNSFYVYILNRFFSEYNFNIEDNITDSNFFKENIMSWKKWWRDHWIDSIIVDENKNKFVYKLFNFKSTNDFKTAQSNFEWKELDKIYTFLDRVKKLDETLLSEDLNENLRNFVMEIFDKLQNIKNDVYFEIYLVSNYYEWLWKEDSKKFKNLFQSEKLSEITLNEILEDELNDYNKINAKVRLTAKDFIELNEWDEIRSIILKLEGQELIRLCINNSEIRNNDRIDDYSVLKNFELERLVFEENVRIYLNENKKNQINNNIISTATSDKDRWKFFYFNNWITIVCDEYSCPGNNTNTKSPSKNNNSTLELSQIQIVNWQQTIYSLFEAYKQNDIWFSDIKVLCKIYEVKNKDIRSKIAEYTNSQNVVKSRDLRSIDIIQDIIQRELETKYNIFYERKKNEISIREFIERIDSEKAWQLILSFFLENPTKAKNKKSSIFWEEYDNIFGSYWSDDIYIVNEIFKFIEEQRKIKAKELKRLLDNWEIDNKIYEKESYIKHCSLFLLFIIKKLSEKNSIELVKENLKNIKNLYSSSVEIVSKMIDIEFFDEKWLNKKYLLYWPFFKNEISKTKFNELFYK